METRRWSPVYVHVAVWTSRRTFSPRGVPRQQGSVRGCFWVPRQFSTCRLKAGTSPVPSWRVWISIRSNRSCWSLESTALRARWSSCRLQMFGAILQQPPVIFQFRTLCNGVFFVWNQYMDSMTRRWRGSCHYRSTYVKSRDLQVSWTRTVVDGKMLMALFLQCALATWMTWR